jgi:hypothetical protein
VNKVVWYAVRLVVYEPLTEEQKNYKLELEKQLETAQKEPTSYSQKAEIKQLITEIKALTEIFRVIKVSEHIYKDKTYQDVEELKVKLNSDNPILALSHDFSPEKFIERTILTKEAKQEPDKYFKPMDLV